MCRALWDLSFLYLCFFAIVFGFGYDFECNKKASKIAYITKVVFRIITLFLLCKKLSHSALLIQSVYKLKIQCARETLWVRHIHTHMNGTPKKDYLLRIMYKVYMLGMVWGWTVGGDKEWKYRGTYQDNTGNAKNIVQYKFVWV